MKYIKKYKIYEGKDTIKTQDVRDCFNDLLDDKFSINFGFSEGKLNYGYVIITKLIKGNFTPFTISDIVETLLFAVPYLQEEYGLTTKKLRIANNYNRHIFRYSYKDLDDLNTLLNMKSEIIYEIAWEFYIPRNLNIIQGDYSNSDI